MNPDHPQKPYSIHFPFPTKSRFTTLRPAITFHSIKTMRLHQFALAAAAAGLLLTTGCATSEKKLGRGINDITEFARLGEIRRSMEETAIWEGSDRAYTTGFIHGFNQSVLRTGVGVYEILTFPFGSGDPIMSKVDPVYPDSYRPHLIDDPMFSPDSSLRFGGGDVAPMIPGSRFRIFDY